MDVHGKRTRASDGDRVGGQLARGLRNGRVLAAGPSTVQARLNRHLSDPCSSPGATLIAAARRPSGKHDICDENAERSHPTNAAPPPGL